MPPRVDAVDYRLATATLGAGPRVVLVHGFTQSASSWARLVTPLAKAHQVVCVDLPGHGGSSKVAVANLSQAATLVGLAGGRATYVGYSLGARTCLTLALASPDLVEALVLVGGTAGIVDPAERAQRRAADEKLAESIEAGGEEGLDDFLGRWLAGPLFAHLRPEQAGLEARRHNTAAGLASSLRTCGAGTQEPTWDRLGSLTMPVVVVAGERDPKFSLLGADLVGAIGANARLHLLPGVGHAVPFEAPDAFTNLLLDVLAETPP